MSHIIDFPIKTGDGAGDVNLHAFFGTADAAVETAAEAITMLLRPLTYDQLVIVSDRAAERCGFGNNDQLIRDVICDEFGRRHQIMDPVNYPPDGAA